MDIKNYGSNYGNKSGGTFQSNSAVSFYKDNIKSKPNQFLNETNRLYNDSIEYSNQFLSEEDWDNISRLVSENLTIHTIDLLGININELGLKTLGEIIKHNPSIKTLKLHWNYLSDYLNDFESFCESISRSNLIHLYLNNNKISNDLCSSISKLIKNSNSIIYIDLRWNDISNEGAKILTSALKKNNILQDLCFIGNKLDEEILKEVSGLLEKNNINKQSIIDEQKFSETNFRNRETRESNFLFKSISEKEIPIKYDHENVPLRFLEKEKEHSEEFKARYDVQLIVNAKLEKKVRELETIILMERNKVTETNEKFERDVEEERNLRIKFEENVLSLKEDFMIMSIEKSKLQNENDIKLTTISKDFINLQNENKLLKESIERMKATSEENNSFMKEEIERKYEQLYNTIESLKYENEKIKRESKDEIKNNFKDYEKNLKSLQESLRSSKLSKEELERSHMHLQKEMLDFRLESEIKIKEKETKFIYEENKKYDFMVSLYEKKIKAFEISKDESSEKMEILYKEISNIKKALTEEQIQNEKKAYDSDIEKISLNRTISLLNSEQNKLKTEIAVKNILITELHNKISDLKGRISEAEKKRNNNMEKKENENSNEKFKVEKELKLKDAKITELEKMITNLKNKLAKIESEDVKFSETFKSSLFNIIEKI